MHYYREVPSAATSVRPHLSRSMTRTERVRYALAVLDGERPFPKPTKAVIARACGVSPSSLYHRTAQRPLTDKAVAAFFHRIDDQRLYAEFERRTQPQFVLVDAAE